MRKREEIPRRIYPESPLVGVGAVIQQNGKVLLIRRAHDPGKGLWSIPGGLIEVGETVTGAAKREVEEETGISVELGELVDVVDNIVKDDQGKVKFHYVLVDFAARPTSTDPKIHPSSEVSEARWFAPSELKELSITRTAHRLFQRLGLLPP